MQYTTLGKTGLRISRLGFGGIPIQRADAKTARRLFDMLAEHGVNYVDTARAYTVSESYIGEAIRGRRRDFVLATKARPCTKAEMAEEIDRSLHDLGTDYIDLYQIHNPTPERLAAACAEGGAVEALLESRRAGKILHIGLTAHSAEVFRRALGLDWVETMMFPYSIVEDGAADMIAECGARGIGFIAMKPLAGGAIRCARTALRYVASNPAVSVVIPGMWSEEEVIANIEAANDTSPLTDDELREIAAVKSELDGAFCRRCGYCAPCTVGIDIPSVFLFDGYLTRYGLTDWAHERYAALKVRASECVECGACETRCPYELPIRRMIKDASLRFDK